MKVLKNIIGVIVAFILLLIVISLISHPHTKYAFRNLASKIGVTNSVGITVEDVAASKGAEIANYGDVLPMATGGIFTVNSITKHEDYNLPPDTQLKQVIEIEVDTNYPELMVFLSNAASFQLTADDGAEANNTTATWALIDDIPRIVIDTKVDVNRIQFVTIGGLDFYTGNQQGFVTLEII